MKLNPILHSEVFAFCELPDGHEIPSGVVATFRENEATTIVIDKEKADKLGLKTDFDAAWITLGSETSLTDLGVTATFSKILSDNGISCNVFAPIHHDHIFVPYKDGQKARQLLEEIGGAK
jgi:hypothetical protein